MPTHSHTHMHTKIYIPKPVNHRWHHTSWFTGWPLLCKLSDLWVLVGGPASIVHTLHWVPNKEWSKQDSQHISPSALLVRDISFCPLETVSISEIFGKNTVMKLSANIMHVWLIECLSLLILCEEHQDTKSHGEKNCVII